MMRALRFAAVLVALAFASPARAACLTCSCTVTANPLSFGAFSPLTGAPVDAVGSIDVNCIGLTTALDSMTIELSQGSSGSFAVREMQSGANTLAYNIYSDAARTTIWGDGAGGSSALLVQNQLSLLIWTTNTPVYGRIPSATFVQPGTYTDTITITVEW